MHSLIFFAVFYCSDCFGVFLCCTRFDIRSPVTTEFKCNQLNQERRRRWNQGHLLGRLSQCMAPDVNWDVNEAHLKTWCNVEFNPTQQNRQSIYFLQLLYYVESMQDTNRYNRSKLNATSTNCLALTRPWVPPLRSFPSPGHQERELQWESRSMRSQGQRVEGLECFWARMSFSFFLRYHSNDSQFIALNVSILHIIATNVFCLKIQLSQACLLSACICMQSWGWTPISD